MEIVPFIRAFLTVLDGSPLALYQVNMERHEERDHQCQHTIQNVTCHDEVSASIIKGLWVHQGPNEDWPARRCNNPAHNHAIENHAKEKLVIVEANAVRYPWAMMVHFQNALIALRTVMSPVWLCFEAPCTHADAAKLFLFERNNFLCDFGFLILAVI